MQDRYFHAFDDKYLTDCPCIKEVNTMGKQYFILMSLIQLGNMPIYLMSRAGRPSCEEKL